MLTQFLKYYRITYQYNPLIFDFTYFKSSFQSEVLDNSLYGTSTKIRHEGLESTISLILLPDIPLFKPTIGIGYQASYLATPPDNENNPDVEQVSLISTSSPIWRAGINLQISSSFVLVLHYKSSMNTKRENYQFAAGIMYSLDFLTF